jgi:phage terminase large subunit-like protein
MSTEPTVKNLTIYYKPYAKQKEVHASGAKYRMICLGRRSGKTFLAAAEILRMFKTSKRPLKIGWISPSYNTSQRGLDTLKQMSRDLITHGLMTVKNTSPCTVQMSGHTAYFLSADNPNSLRGYFFDAIVIDEAAYIPDETFNDVILPLLLDTDGDMIAITTPRGKHNWFYKYFALSESDDSIDAFHWTTYDNPYMHPPYVPEDTIEKLKAVMPDLSFRQEIMAQFVDADNTVFEEVSQCFNSTPCTCKGHAVIGVDLARKVDDTCFLSMCPLCKKVRDMEVHHGMPWSEQEAKIVGYYKKQNANLCMLDGTGLGDVVQQHLMKEDIHFEAVIMSAPTKLKMYTDLIAHIERGDLQWDDERFPQIEQQFLSLEREVKKTTIAYNACPGQKDDVCDAMALALKGISEHKELHIHAMNAEENSEPQAFDNIDDAFVDDEGDWWE